MIVSGGAVDGGGSDATHSRPEDIGALTEDFSINDRLDAPPMDVSGSLSRDEKLTNEGVDELVEMTALANGKVVVGASTAVRAAESAGTVETDKYEGKHIVGSNAVTSDTDADASVEFDTSKSNLVNYLETTLAPAYLRRCRIVTSSSATHKTTPGSGERNISNTNDQHLPRVMNPRNDTDVVGKGSANKAKAATTRKTSAAGATPVTVSTNVVPSAMLHALCTTPALNALHQPFSKAPLTLSSVEEVQLLGIFGAHDDDSDGFISQAQLSSCLQMLGAVPSQKLVDRYVELEGSRSAHLTEAEVRLLSPAAKKNLRFSPLARKVSLATFLEITSEILPDLRTRVQHDADTLLDFLTRRGDALTDSSSNARGADVELSVKMLRQVLVDSFSPSSLTKAEFVAFMKAAGVPVGTGFESLDEHRTPLSASQFKKNLLL
jgi:hypothetical protein